MARLCRLSPAAPQPASVQLAPALSAPAVPEVCALSSGWYGGCLHQLPRHESHEHGSAHVLNETLRGDAWDFKVSRVGEPKLAVDIFSYQGFLGRAPRSSRQPFWHRLLGGVEQPTLLHSCVALLQAY